MLKRLSLGRVAAAAMEMVTGCSATGVDSIQLSPTSQSSSIEVSVIGRLIDPL